MSRPLKRARPCRARVQRGAGLHREQASSVTIYGDCAYVLTDAPIWCPDIENVLRAAAVIRNGRLSATCKSKLLNQTNLSG